MARADLGRLCPVRWPTPQRRTISQESGVRAPFSMLARDAGLAAMDRGATASAAPRSTSSGEIRLPWTSIHSRTVTWRRPALQRRAELSRQRPRRRFCGGTALAASGGPSPPALGERRPTAGREGWLPESTEERVASRRRWVLAASTISAMLGPQDYRR